jgi:hypothetical protein
MAAEELVPLLETHIISLVIVLATGQGRTELVNMCGLVWRQDEGVINVHVGFEMRSGGRHGVVLC